MTQVQADVGLDRKIAELRRRLEVAWCRESSANPDAWSPFLPSTGQCAVTALIVQDRFGGKIVRVEIPGDSHYYNVVSEQEVDLTRDQFGTYSPISAAETRDREYLLRNPSTATRYRLLRERLVDAEWDG
jgi:hypothetical protein